MNIKDLPKDAYARIISTSLSIYKRAEFVYRTDEDSLLTPGTGFPIFTGFFKKIPETYNDFEIEIISKEEFKKADVYNRPKKPLKLLDSRITLQEWNNLSKEERWPDLYEKEL